MDNFITKPLSKNLLPLLIEPKKPIKTFQEFLDSIEGNLPEVKQQLLKHGGLLFRNCPVDSSDKFSKLIEKLNFGHFINYIGGDSPRDKVKGEVYTSTEAPQSFKILLHNELSFIEKYPKHIYFYCDTPPQQNGETIIADAREIYRQVDPVIRNTLDQKGLKYVSCYYQKSPFFDFLNKFQRSHKTWMQVFETNSKGEVESKCKENNFDFSWEKNNWLKISQTTKATIQHPETKENVWFNQIHLYDFNPRLLGFWKYMGAKLVYARPHTRLHEIYFADGTKIPRESIYHIMEVLEKNTIYFPWQKGDVLVLDNVLAMHGRAPFTGKRRILTALTK